jgi:hypothetical protein
LPGDADVLGLEHASVSVEHDFDLATVAAPRPEKAGLLGRAGHPLGLPAWRGL